MPIIYNLNIYITYMTSVSASISVGWPIPTGLKVEKKKSGMTGHKAIYTWDKILETDMPTDPSGGGFQTVYWRVSIGYKTYLVYNNPTFEMGVPLVGNSEDCQTCVKVQTIYNLSNSNLATSDWCKEVCVENDIDRYCQNVNKNKTVTQNYGSMNMRYSRAIRMGRFGSSRGAAAYSFYK